MKKKLILLLTIVLTFIFALAGCSNKVDTVNVSGELKSGNGGFLIEKGEYVYFVNGDEVTTADNEIGAPIKGALMRVKKSDLGNLSNAKVETVLSKIMISGQTSTGVYFFNDKIYFASPYTEKDKSGAVQNSKLAFKVFDPSSGKYDEGKNIVVLDDNASSYNYYEVSGTVYLAFTTKNSDGKTILKCLNTKDSSVVYESPVYDAISMPKDNGGSIFFTKKAYSNELKQDEQFSEIYRYDIGSKTAELMLTGVGASAMDRDGNKDIATEKLYKYSGFEGSTFTLISNTGKYLIYSATDIGEENKEYYGVEVTSELKNLSGAKELGTSEKNKDLIFTASSYYADLNTIYYIDSSFGLLKYTVGSDIAGETINRDATALTIYFVDGDFMYLCNTSEGFYYRCDYKNEDSAEVRKINAIKMQTSSDFYMPRVIDGKYFIASYADANFGKYVYAIDMTGIDDANEEGETENAYAKKLAELATANKTTVNELYGGLLGKMSDADKEVFDDYVEGLEEE